MSKIIEREKQIVSTMDSAINKQTEADDIANALLHELAITWLNQRINKADSYAEQMSAPEAKITTCRNYYRIWNL